MFLFFSAAESIASVFMLLSFLFSFWLFVIFISIGSSLRPPFHDTASGRVCNTRSTNTKSVVRIMRRDSYGVLFVVAFVTSAAVEAAFAALQSWPILIMDNS